MPQTALQTTQLGHAGLELTDEDVAGIEEGPR
jgi:hypothetical protein